MPTVKVNLDKTQYVQVNTAFNPMVLQSQRDSVRIAISTSKPALNNTVFHMLEGGDPPLYLNSIDTNVWALSMTDNSTLIVSETSPMHVSLYDGLDNPISSLNGAIDVHNADVHKIVINDYMHRHGTATTLAVAASAGDTSIQVTSADGFSIGDLVHLGPIPSTIEPVHPEITNIVTNTITLDRSLDFSYSIGEDVTRSIADISSLAGTLAVPVSYRYTPQAGRIEHIKRIILSMTHSTAAADSTFGNLARLTNGVILRAQISGQIGTFTNWKNNSDIILDMFDVIYTDKAGPSTFGTTGRGSFSELDSAVILDQSQGDFLELLVQDDITALASFRVKAQGHVEGQ